MRSSALVVLLGTATLAVAPTVSPAAGPDVPRARADAPVAVALVPEFRGRGKARRLVTRVDAFSSDGTRRRVRTVPGGGFVPQPSVSPDRRRVAFALADGRIAVVVLRGGALRRLRPPGLPRPRPADAPSDRSRWTVVDGASTSWSPDGRVVVAHALVRREPDRWGSTLVETRSVACVVASGRCTTAGAGAPADLVPLAGGRTLRLDGPSADDDDRDGRSTLQLDTARERRTVLADGRRAVRAAASVVASSTGEGRRRVLRALVSTTRDGAVALGAPVAGPAGVLIRRSSTRLGPPRPQDGFPTDRRDLEIRSRVLAPWIVSAAGRLRTLPARLGISPIGSLADGRWLVPTAQVGPREGLDTPEPGLATLDRRGRAAPVLVGGRPVTPVRLALDAGLPDTFAAGANLVAAWPAGGDLLVELRDTGYGGGFFFPGDGALVRLPLDGTTPPRIVDHRGGASYDVR